MQHIMVQLLRAVSLHGGKNFSRICNWNRNSNTSEHTTLQLDVVPIVPPKGTVAVLKSTSVFLFLTPPQTLTNMRWCQVVKKSYPRPPVKLNLWLMSLMGTLVGLFSGVTCPFLVFCLLSPFLAVAHSSQDAEPFLVAYFTNISN